MKAPARLLSAMALRRAGDQADWLAERFAALAAGAPERDLHIFLGLAPRRLGKPDLAPDRAEEAELAAAAPGVDLSGWSLDGAARVAGLALYAGARPFAATLRDLRRTADAAELITLFRGLPFYPEPESLLLEAGEALRSNMRAVFEAVAHGNPYPQACFDEHRWNQMVLKALFVGSRLAPIVGLDARANPELARVLRDFAHERRAAGRPVPAELWRCVGPFATDPASLDDLRLALDEGPAARRAAALALAASPAPAARALLVDLPEAAAIASGSVGWDDLDDAA